MPTSSQALILTKNDAERVAIPLPTCQTSFLREAAPMAHATIYNLNGCVPLTDTRHISLNGKAVQSMGRQSSMRLQVQTLNNCTSVLAWDHVAQALRWQLLDSSQVTPSLDRPVSFHSIRENRTRSKPPIPLRPQSAIAMGTAKVVPPHAYPVDPATYSKLVDLGFRKSSLVVDKTIPPSSKVNRPRSSNVGFLQRPKTAQVRTEAERHVRVPATTSKPIDLPKMSWQNDNDVGVSSSGDDVDNDDDDVDNDADEDVEFTRIKPTIYMRKDCPDSRPNAGVFSFRDNENISHADVKYLIEYQLGVRVASIQFDPLNVRVPKEDVRSRWFVEFKTKEDLETAVRNGLIVGKDKIIVYRFDDLTKREMSSFKFFMTVQEAKKKMKGSTSFRNARATQLRRSKSNRL